MCGYQVKEKAACARAISLAIPERTVSDVRTLVIGCCEEDSLPAMHDLEKLMPLALLTTAGGKLFDTHLGDRDGLRFLEELLTTATDIEHIVVCLHTGCSYIHSPPAGHGVRRRLRLLPEKEEVPPSPVLADERALRPYEQQLLEQLRAVATMLEVNPRFASKQLMLHGWLYEPEIDWTSFFDLETGLLLPLNAHTELCL